MITSTLAHRIQLLLTRKFCRGTFEQLKHEDFDDLFENQTERLLAFSRHAEIESCGRHLLKQVQNPERSGESKAMNFWPVYSHFGRQALVLRENCGVSRVILLSVDDFFRRLSNEGASWLSLLKAAQECFYGEIEGFADLSEIKLMRH
jgi:hypothetical protein